MILVTVGMQLGFDRLIEAVDKLAPDLGAQVIAQTGKGTYQPLNMEARTSIAPAEFEELVQQCQLIISHAGIGTILTAQRFAKPIVLFPRRFDHGEHRNDHQVATVQNLQGRADLLIALEEAELKAKIAEGLELVSAQAQLSLTAKQLRGAIAGFIEGGKL